MSYLYSQADVVKYGIQIPNRVFVGGVAFDTKEEDLKDFFSQFGKVKECKIIKDNQNISRGFAFVTFECKHDAVQTQQLGTVFFNQKKLNLGPAIRQKGVVFNGSKDVENEPVLSTGVYIHPSGYSYTVAPNGVWYFHNADGKPPTRVPGSPPMAYAPNIFQRRGSNSSQASTEQTILLRRRQDSIGDNSSTTTDSISPTTVLESSPINQPPSYHSGSSDVQTMQTQPPYIIPQPPPYNPGYVHHAPLTSSNIHVAFQNMSISSHISPHGVAPAAHMPQVITPAANQLHALNGCPAGSGQPLQYTRMTEMYLPYYGHNKQMPPVNCPNGTHLSCPPQSAQPLHYHYNYPIQKTEYYVVPTTMPQMCFNQIKDSYPMYQVCNEPPAYTPSYPIHVESSVPQINDSVSNNHAYYNRVAGNKKDTMNRIPV